MSHREVLLAGSAYEDGESDLGWMIRRKSGSAVIRMLGYAFRKTLRRCTSAVTFDRASFEQAVAAAPDGALYVLAPSHRSYFDFLLMSYLCFQHPELGIPIPYIAAAEEFSRIPLVGQLLRRAQAFYIQRGVGKASTALNEELARISEQGGSLMFFIEGQRSRSRHTLTPRRGLLRGLQSTGKRFVVIPISLSYDRLPEESAFANELSGGDKPKMSMSAIVDWLQSVASGDVQLGRVHIAAGQPAQLDPHTDVPALSQHIVQELARHTTISRYHVRSFLAHAGLTHIDEDFLISAIQQRGGQVLDSSVDVPTQQTPSLQQALRNQWMHWFFSDARALFPNNFAVRDHIRRRAHLAALVRDVGSQREDPRLRQVVEALFRPVVLDYELAVRQLGERGSTLCFRSPKTLVRAYPVAHLPHLEDVYCALAEREILSTSNHQEYDWGPAAAQLREIYLQITEDVTVRHAVRKKSQRANRRVGSSFRNP
jgi:1-acyl-sn-glycerol-3-phosphate acyltransferase